MRTIGSLIDMLESLAEQSEEGVETLISPMIFTSNDDVSEVGTNVILEDVRIVGYLDGSFCQFDLKIADSAIDRLVWAKDGCK